MGFRTGDRALKRGPDEQGGGRGGRVGYLVRFTILPGQAHDLKGVPDLPGDSRSGPSPGTGRSTRTGICRGLGGARCGGCDSVEKEPDGAAGA